MTAKKNVFPVIRGWNDLTKYKREAKTMVKAFKRDLKETIGRLPYFGLTNSTILLRNVFDAFNLAEMALIADVVGVSASDLVVANLGYELAQAGEFLAGCTSAQTIEEQSSVHYRNLDWWLPELKKCVLEVDKGKWKYLTFPGFIGALTGLRKGAYSLAMNQAPSVSKPDLGGTPAPMIVRNALENSHSVTGVISYLMQAEPIFPAFVHVVSANINDKTVVVHLQPHSENKMWVDRILTNHDPKNPGQCFCQEDSGERYDIVVNASSTRSGIKKASHDATIYRVAMIPESGEILKV